MNGVTGRMGTNQHLIRSICAIREQGGLQVGPAETIFPASPNSFRWQWISENKFIPSVNFSFTASFFKYCCLEFPAAVLFHQRPEFGESCFSHFPCCGRQALDYENNIF